MQFDTRLYSQSVKVQKPNWLATVKPHGELAAALFSGLLIIAGWLLQSYDHYTASVAVFIAAYVIGGFAKAKEGIEHTIRDKELNVELLMILAAVGSAMIGYWSEGAILIFIFALSGALENYTMSKTRKEISALLSLQPEEAVRIIDGKQQKVSVHELTVGDLILVKPGERVPVDGIITEGQTNLDESALTGESIPQFKSQDDEVFAGTVNLRGTIYVRMNKPNHESLFQKIIDLVESAQSEKSPSQQFMERFEGKYVKVVLAAVGIMLVLPPFVFGWSWEETLYRACVLLVVASPCALVASIMPAALAAISNSARNGILVKGGAHLENLGKLKVVAFDKTGTLTKGKPQVTDVITREDVSEKELLQRVAAIERFSNHPLAGAIVRYAAQLGAAEDETPRYVEDIAGHGVQAELDGVVWKIGKAEFVGAEDSRQFRGGAGPTLAAQGKTIVYVRDDRGIAGIIALQDVLRSEAIEAIKLLKKAGVHTVMLTGDSASTARAIAEVSGVDAYQAECLPEHKLRELNRLKEKYKSVAMVGDGINDAPALASATVGIAMGEGTDVAMQTADVVLVKNDLQKIAHAVRLSKRMNRIVKTNIAFSISVIALLIASNFMQSLALPLGVIGHEGSTILVILNGLRLLRP